MTVAVQHRFQDAEQLSSKCCGLHAVKCQDLLLACKLDRVGKSPSPVFSASWRETQNLDVNGGNEAEKPATATDKA